MEPTRTKIPELNISNQIRQPLFFCQDVIDADHTARFVLNAQRMTPPEVFAKATVVRRIPSGDERSRSNSRVSFLPAEERYEIHNSAFYSEPTLDVLLPSNTVHTSVGNCFQIRLYSAIPEPESPNRSSGAGLRATNRLEQTKSEIFRTFVGGRPSWPPPLRKIRVKAEARYESNIAYSTGRTSSGIDALRWFNSSRLSSQDCIFNPATDRTAAVVVVILAHFCEALHLLPWMGWGLENSAGHYLDFASAILALTLFPIGYLLHALRAGSTRAMIE